MIESSVLSNSLNLSKELSQRNAVPLGIIPGAYLYNDETPAHRFTTVIVPILDGEHCVVVLSKDFFDENLAKVILNFIIINESKLSIHKPIVLLDGFVCEHYSFDAVALLSPASARQFEHENDMLDERAFVAFPIYRCELAGDESPEIIDTIRHYLLPSLDWKRSPCPKVTMEYRNKRNQTGSRPRLSKLENVLNEVEELDESDQSWVKINNYAGRRCRVAWSQGHFTIRFSAQKATTIDRSVLMDRIKGFVMHDQGS